MNKQIENAVLGFVSEKAASQGLIEKDGTYNVHVQDWKVLDSRTNWDGSAKPNLPEFTDPTPELAILFKAEEGALLHRFHVWGYVREEDLSDEQRASGKYHMIPFGDRVYACEIKSEKLVRIKSKKRTEDAANYLNGFFTAANLVGVPVPEAMDRMRSDKAQVTVTVKMDHYEKAKKPQAKITGFRSVQELVADEFGS